MTLDASSEVMCEPMPVSGTSVNGSVNAVGRLWGSDDL